MLVNNTIPINKLIHFPFLPIVFAHSTTGSLKGYVMVVGLHQQINNAEKIKIIS